MPHPIYFHRSIQRPYEAVLEALAARPLQLLEGALDAARPERRELEARLGVNVSVLEVGARVKINVGRLEPSRLLAGLRRGTLQRLVHVNQIHPRTCLLGRCHGHR